MQAADDLTRGTIRGRLIALLSATVGLELHTRELIRRLGRSPRAVHVALEGLEKEGIVRSRRVGTLRLWSISTTHPLYGPLREIAQRTLGVPARLRSELGKQAGVELAFVFGSFAAGATDAESDVDVFVLGTPNWRDVAQVTQALGAEFGREVNLIAWSSDELRRALRDSSPFLESLRTEPKIWLIGDGRELERTIGALEKGLRGSRAGGKAQPSGRRAKAASRRKEPRTGRPKPRRRS